MFYIVKRTKIYLGTFPLKCPFCKKNNMEIICEDQHYSFLLLFNLWDRDNYIAICPNCRREVKLEKKKIQKKLKEWGIEEPQYFRKNLISFILAACLLIFIYIVFVNNALMIYSSIQRFQRKQFSHS